MLQIEEKQFVKISTTYIWYETKWLLDIFFILAKGVGKHFLYFTKLRVILKLHLEQNVHLFGELLFVLKSSIYFKLCARNNFPTKLLGSKHCEILLEY